MRNGYCYLFIVVQLLLKLPEAGVQYEGNHN
jgi:hypothetical protein